MWLLFGQITEHFGHHFMVTLNSVPFTLNTPIVFRYYSGGKRWA